ncbi:MAG: Ig-like domain-containing protein [Saccharospirillaceae bacterium]|nr:Ig-like domain-containing protein [Saccharospirillaceae bacterium]MCD8532853.1 Ig-like domain-containing protein [Saccharospirillaceae bacterium]
MRTDALLSVISLSVLLTACGGGGGDDGDSSTSNTAPFIAAATLTTTEDTHASLALNARDDDGDALGYSVSIAPLHGVATVNVDGTASYTPEADYHGADSFTVSVSDGKAQASAQINVTVSSVNDKPVFANGQTQNLSTNEDQTLSAQIAATDVDGDELTFSLITTPQHGAATLTSTGSLTYIPSEDFNGNDTLTIQVSDGLANTTATISVNVIAINDAGPIFTNGQIQNFNTNEDQSFSQTISAADADGDELTFSLITTPQNGSAAVTQAGVLTYTPDADFNGSDSLSIQVSDGTLNTSATINFNIAAVNDAPAFTDGQTQSFRTGRNQPFSQQINATDIDNDPLTFAIAAAPQHGSIVLSPTGYLTYTPANNYSGNDILKIRVSDSNIYTTVTINVVINSLPTFTNGQTQNLNTNEDQTLSAQIAATDVDGDELTFSLITTPQNGSAAVTQAGVLTYTPDADFNGSDNLSIQVSDGIQNATANINFTINAVNDAPTMQAQSFTSYDTQTLNGTINAADADGDNLTFSQSSGQSLPGTVTFNLNNDGTFSFQNIVANNSQVDIQVEVSDGTVSAQTTLSFATQTDPLLTQQWHLKNTGQNAFSASSGTAGHDINIGSLHIDGTTGNGVKVAVVDSGLEIGHEDLSANVLPDRSYDYVNGDTDPTPADNGGDHGTSVAGLIAAKGFNNLGGRGVAPNASLLGFNWLETQSFAEWQQNHGGDQTSDVQIINQSYGANIVGPQTFFDALNNAAESHLKDVSNTNNDGKGILMLKSAGNSFQVIDAEMTISGTAINAVATEYFADDTNPRLSAHIAGVEAEASSFYQTVISALNADADNPLSSYSSVGASVWVSAPGGEYGFDAPAMITTDLTSCNRGYAQSGDSGFNGNTSLNDNCNYTSTFNGTSSAAPVASGVAALILEANSNLSWRDVRHIMASTAKKIDADFAPIQITNGAETFIAEPGWLTNDAGYHFHNWYGFGMVDATAAVAMAKDPAYVALPAVSETAFIAPADTSVVAIPEGNTGVSKTISISNDLTVEAVQIRISATHGRDADLAIELTSPAGTKSMVLQPRSLLVMDQDDSEDADFNDTVLLSNAFYGENSQGTWTVKVTDTNGDDFLFAVRRSSNNSWVYHSVSNNSTTGTLDNVSLRIYGH